MPRSQTFRWLCLTPILLVLLVSQRSAAQDDPDQVPLGDIARNLRNKKVADAPAPTPVIDDDNLPKVIQQAESHRSESNALKYLMTGTEKGFHVSAPDATCSLAFTANAKALLSNQYSQMNLPPDAVAKLQGPAVIEGDSLTIDVFNGTNWHLSEISVALTVIRRTGELGEFEEARPEKKQDVTVIYKMRAAGLPWERTAFSAPLNIDMAPDTEWHWAIVGARGYPPRDEGPGNSK